MDAILIVSTIVAALVAFDLAALRWGVRFRPTIGDDHRR